MKPRLRLGRSLHRVSAPPPYIPRSLDHGFTLLELIVVIVIIGVVAAIAIPRFGLAAENAKLSAMRASAAELQKAIDLYSNDHEGRSPAHIADWSIDYDQVNLGRRLTEPTDLDGSLGSGSFGPYLVAIPANPFGGCGQIRAATDANRRQNCSWLLNVSDNSVRPDHENSQYDHTHISQNPW